jgi:hypothetical protein
MKSSGFKAFASALVALAVCVVSSTAFGQGLTTGAIQGQVADESGKPLAGATIEVTDRTNGYVSRATSRENGVYFVPGLNVGTAYTVAARHIGFAAQSRDGITVQLSLSTRVDFTLTTAAAQLLAVKVTGSAEQGAFSVDRKGTETIVSDSLLKRLPNENRSLYDFVRLTPQVAVQPGGVRFSAAGQNNRYNAIQVDGTDMTDRFGLAASQEPGGQSGGRAMTLEAVKEYQVLLSPFDVRQGNFTGAVVNAVTQSGTNEFHGTVFYEMRNQALAANQPFIRATNFYRDMFGGSIGGPIVKDKAHFFLALEFQQAQQGASGPYIGQPSTIVPAINVNQAQVDSFTTALATYHIPAGSAGPVNNNNPNVNTFARFDFQLNPSNRLTVRNTYNTSSNDVFSRSTGSFFLTSNLETQIDHNETFATQLFTTFANGTSNELTVGISDLSFHRQPSVFSPLVTINNVGGVGGPNLVAGTDNSSSGNYLQQHEYELTDNVTWLAGTDHTITVGTHNELFAATNGFLQNSYGNYTFANLAAFSAANPQATSYSGSGSLGSSPVAAWQAIQSSFYIQDKWQPSSRLNIEYGVRADVPIFLTKPGFSPLVDSLTGVNTTKMPTGNWQFSPRVGFNWDMTGDQKNQLRGGTGLFQGAPAFVWMSNMYSNSGVALGQLTCGQANNNGSAPAFNPTPIAATTCAPLSGFTGAQAGKNGQPGVTLNPTTFPGTINVVDPNLKFPQVFRTSLGYDRQLPWNLVATVEAMYSEGIDNFLTTDLNIVQQATKDPFGRVLYGTFNASGQSTPQRNWAGLGDVIKIQNYSGDYSYSFTGQLRKTFTDSWEGSVAYTYSRSYSVSDMTSSVAFSNWQFGRVQAGSQSDRIMGPSAFDQPNRIVANATYTAPWKTTDISFIMQASSGTKFSYILGGAGGRADLNADGSSSNDPMFIPNNFADIRQIQFQATTFSGVAASPAQQMAAFQQFVANNKCVSSQAGQIMARDSCSNPWYNTLDISVRQRLPQIGQHKVSLALDIYNAMNLVNSNWGKIRTFTGNTEASLLTVASRDGAGNPIYTFNPIFAQNSNIFTAFNAAYQYYQIQLSMRYTY